METQKKRVSRSNHASINKVSIHLPKNTSVPQDMQLGIKVIDPIRRKVESLVSVTKVQDIVLDNATRQWDMLLGNDVLGKPCSLSRGLINHAAVVKKYIDTFSLEVVKQTTERLKQEALALKERALAEASRLKELALAEVLSMGLLWLTQYLQAAKLKDAAMEQVEAMKAQAMQAAESMKEAAMAQVGELQAKADALRNDAEEFMLNARAKILQEAGT